MGGLCLVNVLFLKVILILIYAGFFGIDIKCLSGVGREYISPFFVPLVIIMSKAACLLYKYYFSYVLGIQCSNWIKYNFFLL